MRRRLVFLSESGYMYHYYQNIFIKKALAWVNGDPGSHQKSFYFFLALQPAPPQIFGHIGQRGNIPARVNILPYHMHPVLNHTLNGGIIEK